MNEITLSKLATIIIFLLVYCLPMSVVGMETENEKEKSSSTENKPHCLVCSNGGSQSAENTVKENNKPLTNTNTEDDSNGCNWLMRRRGGVRSNAGEINRDNENDEKVDTSPFTHWRERAHSFIAVPELDSIVIGIASREKKYSIVLTLADDNTRLRITFLPGDRIPTSSIESWPYVESAIPIIQEVLSTPASDSSNGNSQNIAAQLALPFNQEASEDSSNDRSNTVITPMLVTRTVQVFSTDNTLHPPISESIQINESIGQILDFLSRDISTIQIATIEGVISSVYAGGPCPSSVSLPTNVAGEELVGTWIHRPQPQSYGAYFMSFVEYARHGVFGHNNYRLIGGITFATMFIGVRISQYLAGNNGPPVEVCSGLNGIR